MQTVQPTRDTGILHHFSDCTQPLKVIQRQAYWKGIRTKPNPTSDRNDQVKQPRRQRVPHQERVIEPLQSLLLPKLRVVN